MIWAAHAASLIVLAGFLWIVSRPWRARRRSRRRAIERPIEAHLGDCIDDTNRS